MTKRPTDDWDTDLLLELTDQTTQRLNVAFGGPITDEFLFRITLGSHTGDGAQKNIGHADDYDRPDVLSYSPQLRFKNDALDINLRYAYSEDTGAPRTNLLLWDPPRNQPWSCSSGGYGVYGGLPVDAFLNTGGQSGVLGGVPYTCSGTADEPENIWYLHSEPAPAVEDCGRRIANECGDLKNIVNLNRPGISDTSRESYTLNMDFKLSEGLLVRYTFGDSATDQYTSRDGDFTNRIGMPNDITRALDGGVPYDDSRRASPYNTTQSSHELQVISDLDGQVNFIAGVFTYENYTYWGQLGEDFSNPLRFSNSDAQAQLLGLSGCEEMIQLFLGGGEEWSCPADEDHTQAFLFATDANSSTRAAFGNVDFQYNDQWSFSAGLRWTEDEKERDDDFTYVARWNISDVMVEYTASTKGENLLSDQTPTWDALIWNVAAEFRPSDRYMYYGRISTGYRAGGFNAASSFNPEILEETLINYEVGVKGLFMDGRLMVSSAAFIQSYDDYQINAIQIHPNLNQVEIYETTPLVEFTDNIPDTEIWGAEIEGTYTINQNWSLSGFYAYQGSEIGPFSSVIFGDPSPRYGEWEYLDFETGEMATGPYPIPKEHTGGKLPMQPEHKMAATVVYERPMTGALEGSLSVLGTWSYSSEKFPYVQNVESQKIPGYSRTDIRAIWESSDRKWSAALYVQNLFDRIGLVEFVPVSTNNGLPMGTLTEPRQLGVQVRWRPSF